MDDRELRSRLRAGDQAAFDTIFRTWYARLVRLAELVTRDTAAAEDVVQEVLLELWRRRELIDISTSLQAYLYQSTRNRALNHARHLQVRQRAAVHLVTDEARPAPAPAELVATEMQAAVGRALAELTPRCREVWTLSRDEGLRYAEIAERLGVTVKAVEAQMGRALRTMREHLAPWLPEGDGL